MTDIKIYWIYFPNEKLGEYIRNEANDENWPTAKKYLEISKDYFEQIKQCKKVEVDNQKVKELIDNIQTWFRTEGLAILDSKEPISRAYKVEDIRPLLKETNYKKFKEFEQKYPGEAVAKLSKYLQEWNTLCLGQGIKPHNSSNIWVRRRDGENIIFHWKVPNGKFNEINNYLFYFYGEWREPILWEVVDYETAQITASFSQFYNNYWHLLKSEVNGIIEHSPLIKEEVCECPDFNSVPSYADFTSDYTLPLALFRTKGQLEQMKGKHMVTCEDPPYASTLTLERFNPNNREEWKTILKNMWDHSVGTCFFVLGSKYKPEEALYSGNHTINIWTNEYAGNVKSWLDGLGLLKPEMEEILRKHIKATLYWRDKHIWQGNYWLLHDVHNQFSIKDSINPSGNSINICNNGLIITKLTESITAKIGGLPLVQKFIECSIDLSLRDDKGQNNRQTERAVLSDNKKVSENHWQSKSIEINRTPGIKESNVSKANRILKSGVGFLQPSLYNVDHTKSEYTIDQFIHRNLFVKDNKPLKMRLEVDQKLINWFRNKKELIGKTGQDFYNGPIANLLNVPGHLQMKILTSNFPYNHWFRNRLEGGINLYEKDFKEIYQKKLSNPLAIVSIGDIRHNNFEIMITSETLSSTSAQDDISHIIGLFVYKDSYIRNDQGQDLMRDWLIPMYSSHMKAEYSNDPRKWVFKHPDNFGPTVHNIPSNFFDPGKDYTRVDYFLHFYSSAEPAIVNQELHAAQVSIERRSEGNKGIITIGITGSMRYKKPMADLTGVPVNKPIPGAGITPTIADPEYFDPNIEIPKSAIGEPTPPVESGGIGIHIEVAPEPPLVEEIKIDEVPVEPPIETPIELPTEAPVEPTEPPVDKNKTEEGEG